MELGCILNMMQNKFLVSTCDIKLLKQVQYKIAGNNNKDWR